MQSTDTAAAVDLPRGNAFTTEVGDLLFSLQAVLIHESEGTAASTLETLEVSAEPFAPGTNVPPSGIGSEDHSAFAREDDSGSEATPARFMRREPEPALFDPSTGAPTFHALRREIELRGSRVSNALVALDVKPLTEIRAQHGNAAADAILRAIVEAVPFALRAQDQVYRTGEDELTLCMPGAALSDAAVMSLRLQMAVKDVLVRRELPPVMLSIRPFEQAVA